MIEEIVKEIAPIIVTVITGLVAWGLTELSRYVRSKTRNENALAALEDISGLVRTMVSELSQTFTVAAEDGKITKEEGIRMKKLARAMIKQQIPSLVQKNAKLAVNNLNDFINSRIEREVVKLKQKKE